MNGESDAGKGASQEELVRALETFVEVLVRRELDGLRGSVEELDSKLSEQIATEKRETTERIDKLEQDLSARIHEPLARLSETEEAQRKALSDLDERTGQSVADLEQRLEDRIQAATRGLEDRFSLDEQTVKKELNNLTERVFDLRLQVQQQTDSTQHTSALLDKLASLFSGTPRSGVSAAHATASNRASGATASEAGNEAEIDNVLDQVFHTDDPSSEEARPKTVDEVDWTAG
jgi:hypothetical protein